MRLAYMAAGVIAISSVASADTLKVPQQFETIQAAVDAANDGDTIAVARGVYNENVVLEGVVLLEARTDFLKTDRHPLPN